jgi:hypothetical protein
MLRLNKVGNQPFSHLQDSRAENRSERKKENDK